MSSNINEFLKPKSTILTKVFKNAANSPQILKHLESILLDLRPHVVRLPKPKTPVIVFFSGGLDTIAVTNILLEEYKLSVYPLYINRHLPHSHQVRKSVKFFSSYFQKKYPDLFHPVFTINQKIPCPELKSVLLSNETKTLTINQQAGYKQGIPLQPAYYSIIAQHYSKYLEKKYQVSPKTIIGAWLPANSVWFAYESFQALRSSMVNLCLSDHDPNWQFISLPLEPELGLYLEKEDLIRLTNSYKLPLDKTWTCWKGGSHQCGFCGNCFARKEAFQKAKVVDQTIYSQNLFDQIKESIQFSYAPNR